MPGINPRADDLPLIYFAKLHERVRALETQQQQWITNALGEAVAVFGLLPGSDPDQYGLAFYNPATGALMAFFGEDGAGNAALYFYNASGILQLQLDENGLSQFDAAGNLVTQLNLSGLSQYNGSGTLVSQLSTAGLSIYNSGGTLETVVGQLSDGHFGIEQLARQGISSGSMVDLGYLASPVETSNWGTQVNSTSTSPTIVLSNATNIGPSGTAIVYLAGLIYVSNTNVTCSIDLYVDGNVYQSGAIALENNTGGSIGINGMGWVAVTGLTEGLHHFASYIRSSLNGDSVHIANPLILVQPY